MNADEFEAEISYLLNQMEHQPEDRYELYLQLQERIHEMQAYGMPIPEDLQRFVRDLEREFTQGAELGEEGEGDGGGDGGG
ncbi:hypothetical protein [Dichotomicrobium thermohalophilum]|uniref:Uncharacterized protein n=1 Tax=Dichotomicrobium thermohalophilum TaxID=933063 RepID=A0A397Q2F0_9HYPH|nr:hypothetical protein [Dichotomicrobium thermohalophilum]RIA55113.1 hypothetical protein BXY53_0166 [Dichotomicrobium thermohalophilum]